jgi:hypothetical protein
MVVEARLDQRREGSQPPPIPQRRGEQSVWTYITLVFFIVPLLRVIHITFGLSILNNIKHIFGGWVQEMNDNDRKLLLIGMGAILWSIWLNQNDIVFNKTSISTYIHIIFRATYWTRAWSVFQKEKFQVFLAI